MRLIGSSGVPQRARLAAAETGRSSDIRRDHQLCRAAALPAEAYGGGRLTENESNHPPGRIHAPAGHRADRPTMRANTRDPPVARLISTVTELKQSEAPC